MTRSRSGLSTTRATIGSVTPSESMSSTTRSGSGLSVTCPATRSSVPAAMSWATTRSTIAYRIAAPTTTSTTRSVTATRVSALHSRSWRAPSSTRRSSAERLARRTGAAGGERHTGPPTTTTARTPNPAIPAMRRLLASASPIAARAMVDAAERPGST